MPSRTDVTRLLNELSGGDRSVLDRLVPAIYDDLREMAHSQLRRERADHTLNTTALVHEAYLKLARAEQLTWKDRAHFFAVCAQSMRRILVNYARMKGRDKRGAGAQHVPITDVVVAARQRPDDLVAADQALSRLEALNARQARVVEYRVFGGMSVEDTAEVLDVSVATVKRDWASARAWLNREMGAGRA
ncbi:MAG: sigma-70 family RNA polymerase sigma factor [Gemmatimonadota bacterium]|jgi:RNA polymerase sigma factor (TIGR02999 family)